MGWVKATRLHYAQALSVEMMYRFALFQGFITLGLGLVATLAFWTAAGKAAGPGAIYTSGALVAYFLVSGAQGLVHDNRMSWNLSASIRMGKLSASMLRPYPFLVGLLATGLAHTTIRIVILAPVILLAALFAPGVAAVFTNLTGASIAVFAAAMVLAIAMSWATKLATGMLAFDLTQTWGPELISVALFSVASGQAYPPDLLPGALHTAITWSPFYYAIGFPTLVLLGRISPDVAIGELGKGTFVLALAALLCAGMWRRGLGRFEAVGI